MVNISNCSLDGEVLSNALRMLKLIVPKVHISNIYKLEIDGNEKYLIKDNSSFFIMNMDNNLFSSVDIFAVDNNDNINYLRFHGTDVVLDGGVVTKINNDVFIKDEELGDDTDDFDYYSCYVSSVKNAVTISSIDEVSTRFASYNSLINFIEYNFENGKSLFYRCFYQAKFDGSDRINEAYLKMPFHLNVVDLKSTNPCKEDEEYFLTEWNRDHKYYGFALLKLVGLWDYQKDEFDDFEYYYDKPLFDENGKFLFWNMIFSKMYDINFLKRKIKNKGFEFDIPQDLIDLFNGDNENYLYCKNILNEYNRMVLKKK